MWDTTMAILPNQYSAMAYTSFYNLSSFGTSFKVAIKSGRHQLLNFAVENRQEWEEPSGLGSMRRRCKQCKDIWLPLCLWNHRLLLFLTSVKNSRERTCASWTPSTVLSFRGGYLSCVIGRRSQLLKQTGARFCKKIWGSVTKHLNSPPNLSPVFG